MNKNELQKTYQEIVLKTNGGVDDYVVALCRIGSAISELDDQQQQIADLQHRLEVAEIALSKAVNDKCKAENIIAESIVGKGVKVAVPKKEQWYLEQAEKETKGK